MKQELSHNADGSPGKPKKAAKDLYEPYSTPSVVYEFLRWFIIVVFALVARMHVRNRHNIPKHGPYIIAANHLSWTDIPLLAIYVPGKVIYMAKEETFFGKFGWITRFLGAFPIKRGEGDRHALKAANEQLKKGKVLVIFPEGTRSKTKTMAKGLAGLGMIALRANVPVVPVAIWGSENALKKFGTEITISYGEPMLLQPKGTKVTREDIDGATDEVMRRIASMLPERYRGAYGDQQ